MRFSLEFYVDPFSPYTFFNFRFVQTHKPNQITPKTTFQRATMRPKKESVVLLAVSIHLLCHAMLKTIRLPRWWHPLNNINSNANHSETSSPHVVRMSVYHHINYLWNCILEAGAESQNTLTHIHFNIVIGKLKGTSGMVHKWFNSSRNLSNKKVRMMIG